MVYLTGDIHGRTNRIVEFAETMTLTKNDTIIILGDVGANYYQDNRDRIRKDDLARLKPTIFCIHGNHECRPCNIGTYELVPWNGGNVWVESEYPNILFAKDGDIYTIEGMKYLVIGGAYSVDKFYRLATFMNWFPDEQPSDEIKSYVEQQIQENHIDIVLSHTCPIKYEPTEMFLPQVDQSKIDKSTEIWLDSIEERLDYLAWFCGHFHTDKHIDKMHFMYTTFETAADIKRRDKSDEDT